jgi:hypothetical protein
MGFNPFKKSSWKKVGNDINKAVVQPVANTVTNTANTVAKETTKAVNVAGKTIVDTSGKITNEAVNFANETVNNVKNQGISTAGQVRVAATRSAMATAKVADAALNDVEAGSKLAVKAVEQGARQGVYAVQQGGELIAEWVEANYCQIGVSIALGTVFAALLYRPEPSSQATTVAATAPLSSTAILYLSAKETVGAVALGTACDLTAAAFVELIWMAPDVRKAIGNSNKKILTDAIAFTLAKSMDAAAGAMIVPQSCAAVVAGIVTTLVAQLACERTLPNGAREWATTGASGL